MLEERNGKENLIKEKPKKEAHSYTEKIKHKSKTPTQNFLEKLF